MADIWEKAKSILVGNLNSGLSYIITTVLTSLKVDHDLNPDKTGRANWDAP